MRTDFLTEEERLYLEEHLEEVILVFRQSCDELYEKLKYRFYKNIKEYLADNQISSCKRLNK